MKTVLLLLFSFYSVNIYSQTTFEMTHPYANSAPGKTNQAIIKFHTFGETLGTYILVQFQFNTNGSTNTSDILSAKVYWSYYPMLDSNAVQFGSTVYNPSGSFTFDGSTMVYNGHKYFWLVYDISGSAVVNNVLDAECTHITVTSTPPITPSPASPPGNIKIVSPMNGVYTIGTGGNYPNLTQGLNALSQSAIGTGVTFELMNSYSSSNEQFPVVIPDLPGAGAESRLIIRPQTGSDTVKIFSGNSAAFDFDGAGYVTIDGRPGGTGNEKKLQIQSGYNSAAIIHNNAYHNSILNTVLSSTNYFRSGTVDLVSGIEGGAYWNSLKNCNLVNVNPLETPAAGIYSRADSGFVIKGTLIENCLIKNFGQAGIWFAQNTMDVSLLSSEIYEDTTEIFGITAPVYGIIIDSCGGQFLIQNNRIHHIYSPVLATYTARGIYINSSGYIYPLLSLKIYNNFISMGYSYVEANMYCLDYNGNSADIEVFNNTLSLNGGAAFPVGSACLRKNGAAGHFNIRNNILINKRNVTQNGNYQYAVSIGNVIGLETMDYNDYYASGNNNYLGWWAGNNISTIEMWRIYSGRDLHSVSRDVNFVSSSNLHLAGSSLGDFTLAGIFLPETPLDIDGEPRPQQYPYMGADENLAFPLPVELTSFTAESNNGNVRLKWSTASELNNKGFEVERSDRRTGTWNTIVFIQGEGNSSGADYSYTDANVPEGFYTYRLKQIDFNGTYTYSEEIEIEVSILLSFKLEQNYPNPFNPSTVIDYEIPEKGMVILKVYDVLGNECRTLVNSVLEPGRYKTEFNAEGLSTGVYFYQIRHNGFSVTIKMLYLR